MSAATDGGRLDTILAAFTATTMIAHQVAAKTARDSLFLTYFDVTWLPTVTIVAALVSAGVFLATPASAQEELFEAWAVNLSNVATGTTSRVEILIKRWSTDAERDRLVKTFQEKNQDALLSELQKIKPPVGYIRTPDTVGWDLQFAHQVPLPEGGRQIVIVTDRRMSFREASQRPRSFDYPFTLIELHLDQDGTGEGRASIATKITYDKKENVLELENYASEPVRLQNVRQMP